MKDGHPWRWMITKFILRTAVAVSLCGSVYAVWDQYQTGRTFYPDMFVSGRALQGNSVVFPGQGQAGSAEDRDGESDFWEKDDHAAEDRMPEPAADAQQVLKAERETMAVAEEETLHNEPDGQSESPEDSYGPGQPAPEEQQRIESAPVILAGPGANGMEDAGGITSGSTVMVQIPGTGWHGDDPDDDDNDFYGGSSGSQGGLAGSGNPGGSGNSGSHESTGNGGGSGNGSGSENAGSMPEPPLSQPTPPANDSTAEDPDPVPEIPVNPSDEDNGIVSFPTEGIPDDGTEHEYALSFTSLDEDASGQLYYDQILNEWKLLCAVYAYVEVDGVRRYRLDQYSDCFQVNEFPDVATEDFGVTFSFRPNTDSQWQEADWEYPVQPYKLVLEDWDGSEMDSVFPKEGEAVNLLKYNSEILEYEVGDSQEAIFPGWTEQPEGETVGNTYTVAEKGRQVLHPVPMKEVPEGMEVALQTAEIEEEVCYVQTLTSCDSYENDEDGTLDIPQGIQRVAAEEEQGIRAMTMKVPECVMDIASGSGIAVDGEYQVDEENKSYSSQDGVLFDREQTVLYQAPLLMESIVVPGTVKEIYGAGIANVSEIRFLSEEPPVFDSDTLKEGAKVYVPTSQYYNYLSAWGRDQYHLLTEDGEKLDYKRVHGALLSEDGTILFGLEEDISGIYFIPDGVRVIRQGALEHCSSLEMVILPRTVEELETNSLSGENVELIVFRTEEPPMIAKGAFGDEELPMVLVPAGAVDGYRTAWGEILGEDYVQQLIQEGSSDIRLGKDGVLYQLQSGSENRVMLWKVPEDLEQFTEEHVPDGLTLTEIGAEAFSGCSELAWVELPDTVKVIRTRAFAETGLKELSLPASVKTLEMDFLEDTDLEILNINGEKPPKLDYGKEGTEYSFGCDGVQITLNGEEAAEQDSLTQQYIDSWRTQMMGYASAEELFWKIYKDEFWNWGLFDRDEFHEAVWDMTMEILGEGENRVRVLLGLEEAEAEVSDNLLQDEIIGEIPDEDILEDPEYDEKIGTDSNADRDIEQENDSDLIPDEDSDWIVDEDSDLIPDEDDVVILDEESDIDSEEEIVEIPAEELEKTSGEEAEESAVTVLDEELETESEEASEEVPENLPYQESAALPTTEKASAVLGKQEDENA